MILFAKETRLMEICAFLTQSASVIFVLMDFVKQKLGLSLLGFGS